MSQDRLVIASRGSKLALWQAEYVADRLRREGIEVTINVIKTTGDRVQDRFLHEIGGKGLFVRELEDALMRGEADLAVHSLKDLPARIPAEFILAAVLKRHSPADALIMRQGDAPPDLKNGPVALAEVAVKTLGTASLRRKSLMARFAPQIETQGLRGNVDTRIAKLNGGEFDAIILAEASLERLGWMDDVPYVRLDPTWFIPCAAQGALAIETLHDSPWQERIANWFDHGATRRAVTLERGLLAAVGGDCTMPFGAYYHRPDGIGSLQVGVYTDGGPYAEVTIKDVQPDSDAEELKRRTLKQLYDADLKTVMAELKLQLPTDFESHL